MSTRSILLAAILVAACDAGVLDEGDDLGEGDDLETSEAPGTCDPVTGEGSDPKIAGHWWELVHSRLPSGEESLAPVDSVLGRVQIIHFQWWDRTIGHGKSYRNQISHPDRPDDFWYSFSPHPCERRSIEFEYEGVEFDFLDDERLRLRYLPVDPDATEAKPGDRFKLIHPSDPSFEDGTYFTLYRLCTQAGCPGSGDASIARSRRRLFVVARRLR